jgi:hypothetical protein
MNVSNLLQSLRDQRGNVLIITAFSILILVGVLSLAFDHGRNFKNQTIVQSRLSLLAKTAGDEYTYWQIRNAVSQQSAAMGLPLPSNEDCTVYVLCNNSLTQAQALSLLQNFVQTQLQSMSPSAPTVLTPVLQTNDGNTTLLFTVQFAQLNDLNEGPAGATITVRSGVLASPLDTRTMAAQIVYSLDEDSLNQLGGSQGQINQLFTLVQNTLGVLNVNPNSISTGLTLGNLPMRGPMDANGNVLNGGLNCSVTPGTGYSGSCYDNQPNFNGTDIGTLRIANQSRKFTFRAEFDATDAAMCAHPVWTYQNVVAGSCTTPTTPPNSNGSCPDGTNPDQCNNCDQDGSECTGQCNACVLGATYNCSLGNAGCLQYDGDTGFCTLFGGDQILGTEICTDACAGTFSGCQ